MKAKIKMNVALCCYQHVDINIFLRRWNRRGVFAHNGVIGSGCGHAHVRLKFPDGE